MVMARFATNLRTRRGGDNLALTAGNLFRYYGSARAGVVVNEDTALALTAVYRSVVLIASAVAGQPLHLYERPGDVSKRIEPLPLRVLWDRPNPEMSRVTFWEIVIGHEVMGDAFIFVVKNAAEQPLELWPIEPRRVRVGRTSSGQKVYQIDHENNVGLIDYRDGGEIIHIPNWGSDGLRGMSPIKAGVGAISLGLASQQYADAFFANGSTPSGVLTSDQVLSQDQADVLKAKWEQAHTGLDGSHRIAVLGAGSKFQQVSVTPEDAQLLEERRFQLAEVARLFGIPPHMLGDTERSTSWGTGIEEQTLGFVTFTLQAHINRFEQAINDAILRRGETKRYMKFELEGLLRGTTLRRYQSYAMGYGRWLAVNDIRRLEDMPLVEGGDDVLAQQNLVPLEDLGEVQGEGDEPPPRVPVSSNGNGAKP